LAVPISALTKNFQTNWLAVGQQQFLLCRCPQEAI